MNTKTQSNFDRYLNTRYGTKLLEKYPDLTVFGTWRVRGEDPNCDFGGHHYMPDLGVFSGKLMDVIFMAVEMPGFWSWGGGGEITDLEIKTVKDVATQKARREAVVEKRRQIDKLEQEIKALGAVV